MDQLLYFLLTAFSYLFMGVVILFWIMVAVMNLRRPKYSTLYRQIKKRQMEETVTRSDVVTTTDDETDEDDYEYIFGKHPNIPEMRPRTYSMTLAERSARKINAANAVSEGWKKLKMS